MFQRSGSCNSGYPVLSFLYFKYMQFWYFLQNFPISFDISTLALMAVPLPSPRVNKIVHISIFISLYFVGFGWAAEISSTNQCPFHI